MSAYVVDNRTISRIVSVIRRDLEARRSNRRGCWETVKVMEKWGLPSDPRTIGQQMLSLNIRAVNARYNEDDGVDRYEFHDTHGTSRIQAYKSLRCWLYQCSEDDIPETGLFQAFEELAAAWAQEIVSDLPDYDKADWG